MASVQRRIGNVHDTANLSKCRHPVYSAGRCKFMCDQRIETETGNVHELQNFIERSVILTSGDVLRPRLSDLKRADEAESLGAITMKEAERDHIRKTLERTHWVVSGPNGAAARFGNQEVYALLPHAKTGHLPVQLGTPTLITHDAQNPLPCRPSWSYGHYLESLVSLPQHSGRSGKAERSQPPPRA